MNRSVNTDFWFTLPGQIPSLNDTSVRPGQTRIQAIIANAKKKKIQKHWRRLIEDSGHLEAIYALQRHCAAIGRKIKLQVFVYRVRSLDMKNIYRSGDELLLDPLQWPRQDPPLYNDRESNIEWDPRQIKCRKSECRVLMHWSVSDQACGPTPKKRLREERKKELQANDMRLV